VGRLTEPRILPAGEYVGRLFREILDGTLIFHPPTDAEKAAMRAERQEMLANSRTPWILNDLGGILQFYDDVQDVVAFARWNKAIFGPKAMADCIGRQVNAGYKGGWAIMRCLCPGAREAGKRSVTKAFNIGDLQFGLPLAALLAVLPASPALMYLLLAGQVSYSLFGVGVRLGAIVGASMELTLLGLEKLTGADLRRFNKYEQLKAARVLQYMPKGIAAGRFLRWDDRLAALVAEREAARQAAASGPWVIRPQDMPTASGLITDPFGTARAMFGLAASLVPNAAAFVVHDILNATTSDIGKAHGGSGETLLHVLSDRAQTLMKNVHAGRCPYPGGCEAAMEDANLFLAWYEGHSSAFGRNELDPDLLRKQYPGLFRPVGPIAPRPF
jgi:hypothetical protein